MNGTDRNGKESPDEDVYDIVLACGICRLLLFLLTIFQIVKLNLNNLFIVSVLSIGFFG